MREQLLPDRLGLRVFARRDDDEDAGRNGGVGVGSGAPRRDNLRLLGLPRLLGHVAAGLLARFGLCDAAARPRGARLEVPPTRTLTGAALGHGWEWTSRRRRHQNGSGCVAESLKEKVRQMFAASDSGRLPMERLAPELRAQLHRCLNERTC